MSDLDLDRASYLDLGVDIATPPRRAHITPDPETPPPEPEKDPPPDNDPLPVDPPIQEPVPKPVPVKA